MDRLRAIAAGVSVAARAVDLRDIFAFGGLGCTTYGVAQYSIPAAWIVCGAVLLALGVRR